MEDVRVEDVRRQARECDRNERESLEQMKNEQKENRRKQKATERQRDYRQRKSNEFASEELEEQRKQRAEHDRTRRQKNSNSLTPEVREDRKKQNAERQRAYHERKSNEMTAEEREEQRKKRAEQQRDYRQRKSNELTAEEREEQRKKRAEQQRDYRQRKSNELTAEEREEQRKKRAEQQRDYRQRRQYLTNIHVSANAELDEEEDSTKVRTLEDIYRRAPRVTLPEINNVQNVEEVQMEEDPIANLVLDEEIQIDDNVFVSFQEMNIRHRKFRDRIDRLAEVQMCHVCQESYAGIQVSRTNTCPMCMRCRREGTIHRFSSGNHMDPGFDPLRMIIQGTAGTGKSYLIGAIKNTLDSVSLPGKSPLLLLAPTGVAAFNISATTIHSALHIPIKEITHLQGPQLITLQEEMKYVKYILIDEMSFIGRNLLSKIDSRLRQAFPESANIPFGGRSIILVGDLGQLPPVMDKPVYASEGLAKELWNSFTTVVTLDTVFQQDGQSNEQKTFRHLLMNVRDAIPTLEDWKILMTRTDTSLDASMKESFDKAIHLFATNDDVHNHNKRLIRSLNCPIVASIATSIRSNYSMERDEEDLELELLIAVGARVMLTSNLWTDAGLVNGALGVIQHIVYNPGSSPPEPPTYVLVRFDNYLGVLWDESIPHVVPITPIEKGNKKQLPLKLAWGLTIHKSQGLTLEKATINIGKQKRQGMTFTTISRVKDLAGLRFQPPFSYDRYEKMSKLPGVKIRKDEEERLKLITL